MASDDKITCRVHGEQPRAFVCQHIVAGLDSRERVGFFWFIDDRENRHPDAWCRECEARAGRHSGDWAGDALAYLKPQVLCAVCYDMAKDFHLGRDPWS